MKLKKNYVFFVCLILGTGAPLVSLERASAVMQEVTLDKSDSQKSNPSGIMVEEKPSSELRDKTARYSSLLERDKPFLMSINDVHPLLDGRILVTGHIDRGKIKAGEEVEIVGLGSTKKTVVTGIEMFRKSLDQGEVGDNVGFLLRGIEKEDVKRGMVLAAPGSIKAHTTFKAETYILPKTEGVLPRTFFTNDQAQFYRGTIDLTGTVKLDEDTGIALPGDTAEMKIELAAPIALEAGYLFEIHDRGQRVATGIVSEILK